MTSTLPGIRCVPQKEQRGRSSGWHRVWVVRTSPWTAFSVSHSQRHFVDLTTGTAVKLWDGKVIPLQLPPDKDELQHCPNTGGTNPDEDLGGSQCSLQVHEFTEPLGLRGAISHKKKHSSRTAPSCTVAVSCMCLFKFNLVKMQRNLKFSPPLVLTTLPVLGSCVELGAAVLKRTYWEHFYHHITCPANILVSPI